MKHNVACRNIFFYETFKALLILHLVISNAYKGRIGLFFEPILLHQTLEHEKTIIDCNPWIV